MELTHEFEVGVPIQEAWTVLTDLERIAPCLPGAQLQEVEGDEYRGTVKVKVGPISAQYKGKAHFSELDEVARRAVLTASGRDTKGQGNASATISAQLADVGGRTQVSLLTDLNLTGKVAQFGRGVLADVSGKLMSQFVDNLEATVLGAPPEDTLPPISTGSSVPSSTPSSASGSETSEAAAADEHAEPTTSDPAAPGTTDPATEPSRDAATSSGATPEGPQDRAPGPEATTPTPQGPRRVDSPEVEPVDLLETAGTPVLKRLIPVVVLAVTVALVLRALRRRR